MDILPGCALALVAVLPGLPFCGLPLPLAAAFHAGALSERDEKRGIGA